MQTSRHSTLISTALLVLGAAALGSCSREAAAPADADKSSASQAAARADGSPRIVTSPDGVHIEYRVQGSGDPAIVFVHGWSCDANYWNAQVPEFAKAHTVVTLNLAGHGSSGRNRTDWSMAAYGADVAAVLSAIPNEAVILVGHSMGGPVVIEAARQMPDRVIKIIGVDTFANIGQQRMSPAERDKWLAAFREDFIGTLREFVSAQFFAKDADPALVRKVAEDMSLAPPEVAIPSLVALYEYDIDTAVGEVRAPVVAINSDLRGPTDEARIRAFVPQFRLRTMPGLGHFLMMEDPAAFNRVLAEEIVTMPEAEEST